MTFFFKLKSAFYGKVFQLKTYIKRLPIAGKAVVTVVGGGTILKIGWDCVVKVQDRRFAKEKEIKQAISQHEKQQRELFFKITALGSEAHMGLFADTSRISQREQIQLEVKQQQVENDYWQKRLYYRIFTFQEEKGRLKQERALLDLADNLNKLYVLYGVKNYEKVVEVAQEIASKASSKVEKFKWETNLVEIFNFCMADVYNILAKAQTNLTFLKEAVESYDQAIKLNRYNAALWTSKASLLVDWVDYDLREGPLSCRVHLQDRYKDAIKAHQEALKLKPSNPLVLANYSYALYKLTTYDNVLSCKVVIPNSSPSILLQIAEAHINKAIELDPQMQELSPKLYRGLIYIAQDKHAEAEKDLLDVTKSKVEHPTALRRLGLIQCQFWNNKQKGFDYLQRSWLSFQLKKDSPITQHWVKQVENDIQELYPDSEIAKNIASSKLKPS